MKKNYRLKDLMLSQQEKELLDKISQSIGIRSTEVARLLLHQRLDEIRREGFENFSLCVVGTKRIHKKGV